MSDLAEVIAPGAGETLEIGATATADGQVAILIVPADGEALRLVLDRSTAREVAGRILAAAGDAFFRAGPR